MITVSDVSINFSGQNLFSHVDLQFKPGNCYGVIGANGAGKSTFLRILSGDLEPSTGAVIIDAKTRMSVLKQDHFAYEEFTVLDTVIQGNPRLYEVMKQKDALYAKEDFSEEDGVLASDLEAEFAELNGWDAETDAGKLLQGLGLSLDLLWEPMSALGEKEKVKILLAQALFGRPAIILLDEPTNGLDAASTRWLEDFLMDYEGTVIVVSHDRHFLNNVCTHIVDVDFNKIKIYVGNYDFWYESSQLIQRMMREQNRKNEEKIKELQSFIARFSANKSKSRQATSRKKLIEKLSVEEMPASSRRYPYVGFTMDREAGKDILSVTDLTYTQNGKTLLDGITFRADKGDKIAFVGRNEVAITALFDILMEKRVPDSGSFKWGVSTSQSYFPKDNTAFFEGCDLTILQWLQQYSSDPHETYLRGFLGKMLFSGDDVLKPVKVLSGGEKVRCMLSRMMMFGANVILLDQPTNHLDLESITAVNDGLKEFKGNVLFSTYDHEMLQTVANRIIEITDDGRLIDKRMTYEEYLDWQATKE
ncbi:MAG: ABC-F family ATP-binding cassette domain-containing protein [Acutalibacteraceae bacterium]|jgi:ATPase subunit of ABC transporter with duplicated ATPase domains